MNIIDQAQTKGVLFDGGIGSAIIAMGISPGVIPDEWNITHEENIRSIHKAFFQAGAQVATTNSFGSNKEKLSAFGLEDKIESINRKAALIARSVCPPGRYVVGSMGPTGKLMLPSSNYTVKDFKRAFTPQILGLIQGGIDAFLIETQYQLQEALAAISVAKEHSQLPCIVTMTFQKYKKGYFTMNGDSTEQCLQALEEAGVAMVGANCSLTSQEIIELALHLRQLTDLPLLIRPNAGNPILEGDQTVYTQAPEDFAQHMCSLFKSGINAVGGCCGTTPEFISQLARCLKETSLPKP